MWFVYINSYICQSSLRKNSFDRSIRWVARHMLSGTKNALGEHMVKSCQYMTGDKPAGYKFYRCKRYILEGGLTRQKDQEWGGGRANCSSDQVNYLPDHYSNLWKVSKKANRLITVLSASWLWISISKFSLCTVVKHQKRCKDITLKCLCNQQLKQGFC